MVDVDDLPGHLLAELVGENLHIAGQHDQFGAALAHEVEQLRFGLRFVFLGHPDVVEGDVVVHDDLLVVEMVGDDADDVDWQGADLPAIEQVVQAMAETRDHQQDLHALLAAVKLEVHVKWRGDCGKVLGNLSLRGSCLRDEADPHEEHAGIEIVELGRVHDVATLVGEIAGDCRDDAPRGFASHCQNNVFHDEGPCWTRQRICTAPRLHARRDFRRSAHYRAPQPVA